MANATQATLLARVKDFADVQSVTTFDADIAEYITLAVKLLSPIAMDELAPDTSVTLTTSTRSFTIPGSIKQVRQLELYDSDLSDYRPLGAYEWYQHGSKIYLTEPPAETAVVRIFGLGEYVVHATDGTQTTLPGQYELIVLYWATSMFYSALAGNRRKYNIYVGTSGAAADRDVKDSVDFFQLKGDNLLQQRVKLEGA